MYDLISLFQGKYEKSFVGTYYSKLPLTQENSGTKFNYEIASQNESKAQMLIGNISAQCKSVTVKTNDLLDFKINGFVSLQDGNFYLIEAIKENTDQLTPEKSRASSGESLIEYELKLMQIDNPWGLM